MALSGHGATLVFGTTATFTPQYTSIGGYGYSRPSLDTSHLGTTGARTKIGGDLYDISPFTANFFIDPDEFATTEDCCFDDLLFDTGAVSASESLATINYPNAGASSASGAAHITGLETGEMVTDTLMVGSLTVQFNDAPAYAE